jgi:hypothetical protein
MVPGLLAQSVPTGSIAGRVTDGKSRLALAGARVTVAGTALETFAGQSGDYVLVNVPAGARTPDLMERLYREKSFVMRK